MNASRIIEYSRVIVLLLLLFVKIKLFAQAPPNCPGVTGFPATGQTFVVTRTDDWPDENNSPVVGQLRWAIAQANRCRAVGGRHVIQFNIPGPGPYIFKPFIMYPRIQSSVTIDGFSQPGSSYGNPMIVIDGEYASAGGVRSVNYTAQGYGSASRDFSSSSDKGRCFEENYDYTLGGSGTAIIWRGLVLNNFHTTAPLVPIGAIHMNTGGGFIVEGCFIGTDYTGNIARSNDAGITMNSPGNCGDPAFGNHIIGSTNPDLRNIISGNDQWGIQVMKTYGVQILNNYIGLSKSGAPMGNGGNGIQMWLWNYNILVKGNRIENNGGNGITLWEANGCGGQDVNGNRFEGNTINRNALNGMQFLNSGVYDHVVGVDVSGAGTPNEIAYNGWNGVYVAEWWDGSAYAGGASRTVQIRKNSIYCNGQKAINLNYGTPNPGNQNIQRPIINTSTSTATLLRGTAPANKLIDIYGMSPCASCTSSGSQGDGFVWVGSTLSDGTGNWSFAGTFHGQMSATAADNTGSTNSRNTSEYSTCIYIDNLPVTFLDFSVVKSSGEVVLQWTTSFEENNAFFEVQRSTDGSYFETMHIESGAGNSSSLQYYSYTDQQVVEGMQYYYRIRQVDRDGAFSFSKILTVHFGKGDYFFSVAPNPAQESVLVRLSNDLIYEIKLLDLAGQEVLSLKGNKENVQRLSLSGLAAGVYVLKVISVNNKCYQEKMYKE